MTGPDVPTAVGADDRRAVDVGATVVAVPMWPGEGGSGPWLGEGAAELDALGVDLFGALERDAASDLRAPDGAKAPLRELVLASTGSGRWQAVGRALAVAGWRATSSTHRPNGKDPEWLAARALQVADCEGQGVSVRDDTTLAAACRSSRARRGADDDRHVRRCGRRRRPVGAA